MMAVLEVNMGCKSLKARQTWPLDARNVPAGGTQTWRLWWKMKGARHVRLGVGATQLDYHEILIVKIAKPVPIARQLPLRRRRSVLPVREERSQNRSVRTLLPSV